jgi:hypothetical protein
LGDFKFVDLLIAYEVHNKDERFRKLREFYLKNPDFELSKV